MRAMMLSMMTSFKESNTAMAKTIVKQSNSHIAMMEQQRKEMELRMDQEQKELTLHMEHQHCELATFIERSISAVIS
jgi:hypothetical protein